jgi:phosphoglycolate phosphatase
MLRAVIFDFDFTLADSSAGVIDSVNYALHRLGLPGAPDRRIRESIGLSMPDTLAYVAGVADPDIVRRFSAYFIERADRVMAGLTRLYPYVPGVVRKLKSAGLALGIASSKLRYRIEDILAREHLSDYFDAIVGAEDAPHHKPHPDGLLIALDRLGCRPQEALYVGDHPVDAQAAKGAGVPFVAVLTGTSGREKFAGSRPFAIIDDLSQLPGLLGIVPPDERL